MTNIRVEKTFYFLKKNYRLKFVKIKQDRIFHALLIQFHFEAMNQA